MSGATARLGTSVGFGHLVLLGCPTGNGRGRTAAELDTGPATRQFARDRAALPGQRIAVRAGREQVLRYVRATTAISAILVPMRGLVAAILSGLLTTGCSVVGIRTTPEPAYTVERTIGAVEIRRYGPRIAAETTVAGEEIRARSIGFERLAGYIFGRNESREKIAMTAPVAQSTAAGTSPSSGRRSVEMTAPVDQAPASNGSWRIRFFMPKDQTIATLPQPDDKTVSLVPTPSETVAVLRYSGSPTTRAVRRANTRLLDDLSEAGVGIEGTPFAWFYDPPWTIPAVRRNEAVIRVTSLP